jgi:hypothetical protein
VPGSLGVNGLLNVIQVDDDVDAVFHGLVSGFEF